MKNANATRTIVKRAAAPATKKAPARKAPAQAGRAVARSREDDTGAEWHKATEKPQRRGVFQVQTSAGIMYRLWDGKWHRGASNPRDAEDKAFKADGSPSLAANKLPWRGAARPKARGNR